MDIRKIAIGPDYKNGAMHYIVGQKVLGDTHEIHLIRHNARTSFIEIYIINGKQEIMLWKSFNLSMPISIEYNINY
jgi:hypothetical protein